MSTTGKIATLIVTLAVAGCGATPPQAPHAAAKKLSASTGDISTECGLAYQLTAFGGDHRKQLASLESQAMASAQTKWASCPASGPASSTSRQMRSMPRFQSR